MMKSPPHLFVDISSHGFGHLAQTAPVLNALHDRCPALRLSVRCGLPEARLRGRIKAPFAHFAAASDFGFVMQDAMRIDRPATAARYRTLHADWDARVDDEADFLRKLAPDFVLTDVSYLPLAGARLAGIPAAAMCSLNWGDLFAYYFLDAEADDWVRRTAAQISGSYAAASFLALEPAMPMPDLPDLIGLPPVATPGRPRRDELRALAGHDGTRFVLVAFGGIPIELPVGRWPRRDDIVWLVPETWTTALRHPACRPLDACGIRFSDLLASVDAIVTKPGYGTFVEAAASGTPVLYQRRDDWPEQDCLIDWLHCKAQARELSPAAIAADAVEAELEMLWRQPTPERPDTGGADQVADWLCARLPGDDAGACRCAGKGIGALV